MRILIAGILGGIVLFMWGALSHMVLGVGSSAFKPLPNEMAVVSNLKANITEPGMYFVPGMDMSQSMTPEEEAAWTAKYHEGPTAFIVYNPTGVEPMSLHQLGIELLSNILAATIVALMFSWMVPSFGKRVAFGALFGIAAWLAIDVSYWDWYRFSAEFIKGELIDQFGGWLLAGLVMALIVRSRRSMVSMV